MLQKFCKRKVGHARPFSIPLAAERKERTDDPKEDTAKQPNWKEQLAGQEDFLRAVVKEAVQQILEAEMDEALGAEKGERTASRQGYRSGYYNQTLVTRVGKLELRVPQDRPGRFRTEIFERYQRSEKALVSALSEMYVQGVSTRKVKAITRNCAGMNFRLRQ